MGRKLCLDRIVSRASHEVGVGGMTWIQSG